MKGKVKAALLTGIKTSHRQKEELELERMNNPVHLDYEKSKKEVIRITAFEKAKYKFIRTTERLLREFRISYDYHRTDFLFQDQEGYELCMWFEQYSDVDESVFVGLPDRSEFYFKSTNELDAVNYVYREINLPGGQG